MPKLVKGGCVILAGLVILYFILHIALFSLIAVVLKRLSFDWLLPKVEDSNKPKLLYSFAGLCSTSILLTAAVLSEENYVGILSQVFSFAMERAKLSNQVLVGTSAYFFLRYALQCLDLLAVERISKKFKAASETTKS